AMIRRASQIARQRRRSSVAGFAEYEAYDGLGLAELVRQGQVTPDELLDAAIERVEARNGAINAVIGRRYEYARAAIAAGLPDGAFRGVRFLVLDFGGWCCGDIFIRVSGCVAY